MPAHVALLRGINVGGRNRVAMAAQLTRLGGARTAETAGTAVEKVGSIFRTAGRSNSMLPAWVLQDLVRVLLWLGLELRPHSRWPGRP